MSKGINKKLNEILGNVADMHVELLEHRERFEALITVLKETLRELRGLPTDSEEEDPEEADSAIKAITPIPTSLAPSEAEQWDMLLDKLLSNKQCDDAKVEDDTTPPDS